MTEQDTCPSCGAATINSEMIEEGFAYLIWKCVKNPAFHYGGAF